MKTSERINEIAGEIRQILRKNDVPTRNPMVIAQLRDREKRLNVISTNAAGMVSDIIERAEAFYSARKHEARRGGASGLYTEMLLLVERIESVAVNYAATDN